MPVGLFHAIMSAPTLLSGAPTSVPTVSTLAPTSVPGGQADRLEWLLSMCNVSSTNFSTFQGTIEEARKEVARQERVAILLNKTHTHVLTQRMVVSNTKVILHDVCLAILPSLCRRQLAFMKSSPDISHLLPVPRTCSLLSATCRVYTTNHTCSTRSLTGRTH